MRRRAVLLVLLLLGCGPPIVIRPGDESESESGTETGELEPTCPPEQTAWPIECSLPLGCPHLEVDQWSYDLDTAVCMLEALRDRRVGRYSYHNYTGFTDDHVEFQILDELHVQSAGYGWTDSGWQCMTYAHVSLLREPAAFDACIALGESVEQAECVTNLGPMPAPNPEMLECPMP
jgi:hypothetical protein